MSFFNRRPLPLIVIAGVGILVGALYTTPEQVCPSWSISVVEPAGTPVARTTVRRTCQDYSVAGSALETDASTDNLGRAVFPEVIIRAHSMFKWSTDAFNLISRGVHAAYGRHASVFCIRS
jgi:hypothetical protein